MPFKSHAATLRHRLAAALFACGVVDVDSSYVEAPIAKVAEHVGHDARWVKSTLTRSRNAWELDCGYYDDKAYMSTTDLSFLLDAPKDPSRWGGVVPPIFVENGAWGPVRAVVAELLAAEHVATRNRGHLTTVIGGRSRAVDIACGPLRVDAKLLTPMTHGEKSEAAELFDGFSGDWKLTRADGAPFRTDVHLGLVHGLGQPEVYRDGDDLVIRISTAQATVSVVAASAVNKLQNPGSGGRVTYLPCELTSPK